MASHGLDAHSRPPESMRLLMKQWQKSTLDQMNHAEDILDPTSETFSTAACVLEAVSLPQEALEEAFSKFTGERVCSFGMDKSQPYSGFEVKSLPGLIVYPSLLPHCVQIELLNKILHRDLPNPKHKNNLSLYYDVPYQQNQSEGETNESCLSFFEVDDLLPLQPKDPTLHKTLTVKQALLRKLRWVTLGGQYDWTAKVYPSEQPPAFPADVGALLSDIWPTVDAQAAIVNFYTPGDTLSVHRDVSEECDRGLISVSIGCDALFIVGDQDGSHHVTLRLRSGDAIMMSGSARFAWHAVPKVIPNTCPKELEDWPCLSDTSPYHAWKGWLKQKRINLNVRQMRLTP